jgi:hypothetical protein
MMIAQLWDHRTNILPLGSFSFSNRNSSILARIGRMLVSLLWNRSRRKSLGIIVLTEADSEVDLVGWIEARSNRLMGMVVVENTIYGSGCDGMIEGLRQVCSEVDWRFTGSSFAVRSEKRW